MNSIERNTTAQRTCETAYTKKPNQFSWGFCKPSTLHKTIQHDILQMACDYFGIDTVAELSSNVTRFFHGKNQALIISFVIFSAPTSSHDTTINHHIKNLSAQDKASIMLFLKNGNVEQLKSNKLQAIATDIKTDLEEISEDAKKLWDSIKNMILNKYSTRDEKQVARYILHDIIESYKLNGLSKAQANQVVLDILHETLDQLKK